MDAAESDEPHRGNRDDSPAGCRANDPLEQDQDVLDPWYREAISKVEALPENQSGSDKSWVFRSMKEYEDHFSRSTRK